MDVTIIGTGNMARGVGSRVVKGGHKVTVLGKEESAAKEVAEELGGDVTTGVSGQTDLGGEVVVLAVYYPDARTAVEEYAEQLGGKVVVDITNPVNETYDALVVPPDGSASAELAKLAPGARFVKAFNTTFANTLKGGEVSGQPLDVFIAGDDEDAKSAVAQIAKDGGLNPIDTGGLARARELEAAGLLHMSVQEPLGTGFGSALKIVT